MKNRLLLCGLLLFFFQGFAQFSISTVFPMGVHTSAFYDTLFTSRALLEREGIRKITINQIRSETAKLQSYKTEYFITDGRINTRQFTVYHLIKKDTLIHITDTILYDAQGRLLESWSMGSKEHALEKGKVDYLGKHMVAYTLISKDPQRSTVDTNFYYHFYNDKGQLVRLEQEAKVLHDSNAAAYAINASLFYNEDGLLDSIRHDNPKWGTYVFERQQKKKNKVIELETATARHKWLYNASGQCISSSTAYKDPWLLRNGTKEKYSIQRRYYYNKNGTFSKVIEKTSNKKIETTRFSYSK